MMVSALAGEGGECKPTPFHYTPVATITFKVAVYRTLQLSGQIHSPYLISTNICTLCTPWPRWRCWAACPSCTCSCSPWSDPRCSGCTPHCVAPCTKLNSYPLEQKNFVSVEFCWCLRNGKNRGKKQGNSKTHFPQERENNFWREDSKHIRGKFRFRQKLERS